MKKQLLRFTLYAIMISLTATPAVAATHPLAGNGTHLCGGCVIDYPPNKQGAAQFPDRNYARTFAANLNVGEPYTVRLIYFLPNDRQPQSDIDTKMDRLIKDVQQFYAEMMGNHGFGEKTFRFETDATGKAVVHHVNGQFNDAYYQNESLVAWEEIDKQFDRSKNVYLCALDVSSENIGVDFAVYGIDTACGLGSGDSFGGRALIPASGNCFRVSIAAHELGHAFGLQHDNRTDGKWISALSVSDPMTTSFCAAEWLEVNRYFNAEQYDQDVFNTTVQMSPPSLAFPPNGIRLRFEVADPDGLHQVQLHTPELIRYVQGGFLACERLTGTSSVVEFVTTGLTPKAESVHLRVVDVHGNTFQSRDLVIDIPALLSSPRVVSIPDADLAAAVRLTLDQDDLTSHTMLELWSLSAPKSQITDLTGLEHAHYLRKLDLGENNISDVSALAGLTRLTGLSLSYNNISDISALAGLTNLIGLYLENNNISDIPPLAGLTNLTWLYLENNNISDISALAGLTHLTTLNLGYNNISDISALAGLTNLIGLYLWYNNISDIPPLAGLTNLTWLYLENNNISDISALAGLTHLTTLNLGYNNISDISALAGLTNLIGLYLWYNNISDISALAGLTHLTTLNLLGNSIWNVSALAGLTHLTTLNLGYNNISDISALAGLTNLTTLNLRGGNISDVSALAGLTNLTSLSLSDNNISDISPLVANKGLGSGDEVYLSGNPLSYRSIHTHIPALQSRGITVKFTNRTPTWLVKISGDQHGSPAAPLSKPFVVEVRTDFSVPFAGVPVTFAVTAGGGRLSVQSTTTDKNGRAESTLTLGPNLGTNTVSVSAAGVEERVTFTAVARKGVIIPDSNLRAAVRSLLGVAEGVPIGPSELATLTYLDAPEAGIGDLTGLEFAINLTRLTLSDNNISDISALAGLTNLTSLGLWDNNISNISALAGLTNLTSLYLGYNNISNISALAGLTNLTNLNLWDNNISDVSPLAGLTNLTNLNLSDNNISDVSPLAGLTNLTRLTLSDNISDISALAGLTNLTRLTLSDNNISDISALAGLTNLTGLWLSDNNISDVSALAGLTNLPSMDLSDNNISDISPLVANKGLRGGDKVNLGSNPLSYRSIYTHIPTLQSRGITVKFTNRTPTWLVKLSGDQHGSSAALLSKPFVVKVRDERDDEFEGVPVTFAVTAGGGTLSVQNTITDKNGRAESTLTLGPHLGTNTVSVSAAGIERRVTFTAISDTLSTEFLWSIPAGMSLIHVPLRVTTVDDVPRPITSIAGLYNALGGAATVNLLITHDPITRGWHSYFGDISRGTAADRGLTDDIGIIANMVEPVTIRLGGNPLGTNGNSAIALAPGINLVGLPLRDSRVTRAGDLLALEGIRGNAPMVILTDDGEFKTVGQAGGPGDIPITGGQSFILTAQRAAMVTISGEGWYNHSPTLAAPLIGNATLRSGRTPVLALRGSIVAPEGRWVTLPRLRVIVKNLSTGRAVSTERRSAFPTVIGDEKDNYQVTFVDIETGRAAQIGDILEIRVNSPSPLIGVQPLRYTVTAEDVLRSRIDLPALVAYEIPAETELLANYPNPFNPETWIPYRLAEDAFVTLTIYDTAGQVVRTLDVGHRIAAVYEGRSKAIHWDGRNGLGEQVASGVYFYTYPQGIMLRLGGW